MIFKDNIIFKCLPRVSYCTKAINNNKTYSKTVLLPQTKFPLRLEGKKLIERDSSINNSKEFQELYSWQRNNLSGLEFVLHDGPPYANGSPHMGHAINKILKDTIIRYKIMQGYKVHYVPGWDCHGLPIELKALTKYKGEKLTPVQIRQKAHSYAAETIEKQKAAFQSWGVIGDWKNAYTTYNSSYIKNQIQQFYKLYQKNLVFRDFKPVYWSPSSRTALAEAELEYSAKHVSTSIILKLKLCKVPKQINYSTDSGIYALIWTTTPWSLPSNQAVSFNSELSYSYIQKSDDPNIYLVASDLIESISNQLQCSLKIIDSFSGNLLNGVTYLHPLNKNKELPFLHSSHATSSKGTGLVHTAPAHGPEDFLVALNNKISILSLVNELGCYNSIAGMELEGKFVLTEGTETVLKLIENDILQASDYVHSYPYDWRTKKPIIIRASEQWFIDTNSIKNRAIELLKNVEIIPKINSEIYKNNLLSQLKKRPYWCISRQRVWGVPIPVFYEKSTNSPVLNEPFIKHLCELIDTHGTDFWWKLPIEELIPKNILSVLNLNIDNIEKGQDILDIWFDSGISWSNALEGSQVADIYLEGVDQFTGWFQSSLMTSVALRDKAPYKTIYVHGFVVDENGLKMSKSVGNVVDPLTIMQGTKKEKPYGVDTLRWWVACHANQDATAEISKNVLQASADEVQKIRSVLRFALGALFDYVPSDTKYNSLHLIDKYLLHLLWQFQKKEEEYIKDFIFNKICVSVINLLTNPVSALYYMSIKDRLYCDSSDSSNRLSAQYVLLQIFNIVLQSVAPVVPHLSEELYNHLPQKTDSSFFKQQRCIVKNEWQNNEVEKLMDYILYIKKCINKEIGANTLSTSVEITFGNEINELVKKVGHINTLQFELADIFQVAEVQLKYLDEIDGYKISYGKSNLYTCMRCRRVSSENAEKLCKRCSVVVETEQNDEKIVNI